MATITPELIAKWDEHTARFVSFMKDLNPTTEQEGRFYHIVTAIANEGINNYWSVREAYVRDDEALVAWSCRNLLELAIFAEFVVASEQNAREFSEDRLIDGHPDSRHCRFMRHLTMWQSLAVWGVRLTLRSHEQPRGSVAHYALSSVFGKTVQTSVTTQSLK
jgi:hypothetical protein